MSAPQTAFTAEVELAKMVRENAYLKLRNAQLQDDVVLLGAELDRLRQQLELRGKSGDRRMQDNGR
jgi:hypothetical protein